MILVTKENRMGQLQATKKDIMDRLDKLPPETLPELQTFITFLQFKAEKLPDAFVKRSRREAWQTALQSTFGIWAGRDDIANDGVTYVQEIRRGHRLNDLLEPLDETD
jgi:hypothetical protein